MRVPQVVALIGAGLVFASCTRTVIIREQPQGQQPQAQQPAAEQPRPAPPPPQPVQRPVQPADSAQARPSGGSITAGDPVPQQEPAQIAPPVRDPQQVEPPREGPEKGGPPRREQPSQVQPPPDQPPIYVERPRGGDPPQGDPPPVFVERPRGGDPPQGDPPRGGEPPRPETDGRLHIPPGHFPPVGQCRIWIDGVPPGQQAEPRACEGIEAGAPAGSLILERPSAERVIRVRYVDPAQPGVVIRVSVFDADSGNHLRDEARPGPQGRPAPGNRGRGQGRRP